METPKRRFKRGWMNLQVRSIEEETHDTKTINFVDKDEGGCQFDYTPGQYLTFRFDSIGDRPQVRSYTMSSSPNQQDFVSVTVKEIEDGFVSKYFVRDVKVGDTLRARGPIGKFCYDAQTDQEHLVMVAAGSGVTPFISALREYSSRLGEDGYPKKLTLLIGYRSKKDLICWEVLQDAQQHPNVEIFITLSRETSKDPNFWHGRIDDDKISLMMHQEYSRATYMTCGPTKIMDLVEAHMLKNGVDPKNIKAEAFD